MKNLIRVKIIIAAIFLTVFAVPVFACQPCVLEKSLDLKQTIEQADLIVTGNRIFDQSAAPDKKPPFIKVQFRRILKGAVSENQGTVRSFFGMCPYGVVLPDDASYVLFLDSIDKNLFGAVDRCGVKALRLDNQVGELVTLDDGETKISLDALLRERVVKPEYKPIVEFLQLLKNGEDADTFGFEEKKGGKWDLEKLLLFVSIKGIAFSDVNSRPRNRQSTFAQLSRSLAGKKDDVWRQFVHLGHIYKQPYPQYSTLKFTEQLNRVVVEMTGGYRLTFSREDSSLKLSKLEYLQLEGD